MPRIVILICLALTVGACSERVRVISIERKAEVMIYPGSSFHDREPVSFIAKLSRDDLGKLANIWGDFTFDAFRCDADARQVMSELYIGGRPVKLDDGTTDGALLATETKSASGVSTVKIEILFPKDVIDGENYACGQFSRVNQIGGLGFFAQEISDIIRLPKGRPVAETAIQTTAVATKGAEAP